MMYLSLKFILFFAISFLLRNGYCKLNEGDPCYLPHLEETGVCTLISLCPSTDKILETGKYKICDFKDTTPILCCENYGTPEVTTAEPPRETYSTPLNETNESLDDTTNSSPPSDDFTTISEFPQVGDKSRQKCKEYGNYVYEAARIEPIPGEDPPPKIAKCEMVQIENIVGGTPALPREFPHMALLGFELNGPVNWICGGSLISEKYVLSAAHCAFIIKYGEPTQILLGDLILNSTSDVAQPQQIPIRHVIPHQDYKRGQNYHDIALIELEYNAKLNTFVRPACLNANLNPKNKLSIASGWGGASILEKVVLDIFTNQECNFLYENLRDNLTRGIVDEEQICAGSRNDSKDACYGDSGGPLQIINSNEVFCTHKIVGVISFGRECGMDNNPGVYTKVAYYIKWIEDIVWP